MGVIVLAEEPELVEEVVQILMAFEQIVVSVQIVDLAVEFVHIEEVLADHIARQQDSAIASSHFEEVLALQQSGQ